MSEINSAQIIGKRVVAKDGRELGTVESIFVETEGWQVTAMAVKVARDKLDELRMKRPLVGSRSIKIPMTEVAAATDNVMLRGTISELTGEPATEAPQEDPQATEGE